MALSEVIDNYKDKFHMQRKDQVGTVTFLCLFSFPTNKCLTDAHELVNFSKVRKKENEILREFPLELYCLVFKQLNSCRDVSSHSNLLVWLLADFASLVVI